MKQIHNHLLVSLESLPQVLDVAREHRSRKRVSLRGVGWDFQSASEHTFLFFGVVQLRLLGFRDEVKQARDS